ncbi:MAG TPA: LysR family transcriptional regulator [Acidobacteriota bacterium]|nr:LysR family transcriptional regulator [Acidobacteriota bacterium]
MELNYHHLFLFWTVAREGSVIQASRTLGLSQPTLSAQLRSLEVTIGKPLFARKGKHQTLTETGNIVFEYATEIFALGKNLADTLQGLPETIASTIRLGISEGFSKLLGCKFIDHAQQQMPGLKIDCCTLREEELQTQLEGNELDVVLSDHPLTLKNVRPQNHLLLESDLMVFGTPDLISKWNSNLPESLNQSPFFMPAPHFQIRQSLEAWLTTHRVTPVVVGEYTDSALIKLLGSTGRGFFVSPALIADDLRSMYHVSGFQKLDGYVSQVFAVTVENRPRHTGFLASLQSAASTLQEKTIESV